MIEENKQYYDIYKLYNFQELEFNTIFDLLSASQNEQQRQKYNILLLKSYCKYYNIDRLYNIIPQFQDNEQKETVAMWLTKQKKLVPKQWMHDNNIKNINNKSLEDIMIENNMPVPQHWQNEEEMTIFDQTYFGITPNINDHKPDEQNEQGFTIAMLLAFNNMNIPKQWYHKPELQNSYGQTVAIIQAQNGNIPDDQQIHDPTIQDNQNQTVAMLLADKKLNPPKEWIHQSDLQDINGLTVAMHYLYSCKQFPLKQWRHDPAIQSSDGFTVAMLYVYLSKKQIQTKVWLHNSDIKNKFNHTVEDYLISNNLDVPQEWQTVFNRKLTNQEREYVQDYCKYYKIKTNYNISSEYNINKDQNTIALYLARQGIIPPKIFMHDINKQNIHKQTIKSLLQNYHIMAPEHWGKNNLNIFDKICYGEMPNINQHKPDKQNCDGQTVAMMLIQKNIKVPQCWYHDPSIQDKYGQTVAFYIIQYKQQIPQNIWQHNSQLKDNNQNTIQDYLISQSLEVPNQWISYQNGDLSVKDKNIIYKYCQKYYSKVNYDIRPEFNINKDKNTIAMFLAINKEEIPQRWIHDSSLTNSNKQTVAMILASQGIIPPDQWIHDPNLQDNNSNTVAMLLAENKIMPPKIWYHKPELQNNEKETVAILIAWKMKCIPDEHWNHDPTLRDERQYTVAMILAYRGIQPPKQWYHRPELVNDEGRTVAFLYSAFGKKIPPKEWEHDPNILSFNDSNTVAVAQASSGIDPPKQWWHNPNLAVYKENTVAMLLAQNKIMPQEQWYHDPRRRNMDYNTVGILLAQYGLVPSKYWLVDVDHTTVYGYQIRFFLNYHPVIQYNGQIIHNFKIQKLNDICQLCFTEGEQEFILTKCNHIMCVECFKQLFYSHTSELCPFCRQKNWYEKKYNDILDDLVYKEQN